MTKQQKISDFKKKCRIGKKLRYFLRFSNPLKLSIFRTYNQLWLKTQAEIEKVLVSENQVLIGRAEKDRELAYKAVSKLYLQYVKIFRTLDTCLDQMVHPQKRILLRKLLDSTIGRILELKNDLVNLDCIEYSYHDVTMADLGLTPSEVELIVPKFVITDREDEIKYWQSQMAEAKEKLGEDVVAVSKSLESSVFDFVLNFS